MIVEIRRCIFGDLSAVKCIKKIKTVFPEIRTITKREIKVAPDAWIDPKKKYGCQYYYNDNNESIS